MDDVVLGHITEGAQFKASVKETVDAVVIGSGCGGAVMAKELAHGGKKVVILERGGLYLPERGDFDQLWGAVCALVPAGPICTAPAATFPHPGLGTNGDPT